MGKKHLVLVKEIRFQLILNIFSRPTQLIYFMKGKNLELGDCHPIILQFSFEMFLKEITH